MRLMSSCSLAAAAGRISVTTAGRLEAKIRDRVVIKIDAVGSASGRSCGPVCIGESGCCVLKQQQHMTCTCMYMHMHMYMLHAHVHVNPGELGTWSSHLARLRE